MTLQTIATGILEFIGLYSLIYLAFYFAGKGWKRGMGALTVNIHLKK